MDRTANWCSREGWFTLADSLNSPAVIGIDQRHVVTPSAPRHPTEHSFASASRLWPFWEQRKCLHCDYIRRFLICPRESALRIEERVTTSGLRLQTSSAMAEVTEAKRFAHWRKRDDLRPSSADEFRNGGSDGSDGASLWRMCWALWWSDRMDVVWRWVSEAVGFMDDSCLLFTFSFWCVFNTGSLLPK